MTIRVSSLNTLAKCPGLHLMQLMDDGGEKPAADTGSAAGRACELFHLGWDPEDALRRIEDEAAERFPAARLEEAQRLARYYMRDPRNSPRTVAFHCELEVSLTLPADPSDPTGAPVQLLGHVDQLRAGPDGVWRVWDLKCGVPSGIDMLYSYAWQLAAYALAATQTLGRPVLPGGVIRLRGYDTKNAQADPFVAPVFFASPWTLDECRAMVDVAVSQIALMREGRVHLQPGPHCGWCPGKAPHLCLDKITDAHLKGLA